MAAMILGLYWIWPAVFSKQALVSARGDAVFCRAGRPCASKFGEYPSYHTLGCQDRCGADGAGLLFTDPDWAGICFFRQ